MTVPRNYAADLRLIYTFAPTTRNDDTHPQQPAIRPVSFFNTQPDKIRLEL
jgi:hypothetical protein